MTARPCLSTVGNAIGKKVGHLVTNAKPRVQKSYANHVSTHQVSVHGVNDHADRQTNIADDAQRQNGNHVQCVVTKLHFRKCAVIVIKKNSVSVKHAIDHPRKSFVKDVFATLESVMAVVGTKKQDSTFARNVGMLHGARVSYVGIKDQTVYVQNTHKKDAIILRENAKESTAVFKRIPNFAMIATLLWDATYILTCKINENKCNQKVFEQ